MKFLTTLILALVLAMPAFAAKSADGDAPTGRFEGPVRGAQAETVEKAMKMPQDSRVLLQGNIVASVAGEKNQYIFRDATGEMTVIITPKNFRDNVITPETKVRLSGKLDKTANSPDTARLRVSQLEIIK